MHRVLVGLAITLALTVPAAATAPQPTKPVSPAFFSGRWYEIARSANANQKDCQAPTYDFLAKGSSATDFVLTCHKGSPTGKAERLKVKLKLPTDPARNKFKVTIMGGVITQEYWVLDRADDQSWSILATSGGSYVWLLARSPDMPAAERTRALSRIDALGYDASRLVLPRHS
jgi:apolipoprotein D and lipocalin family protein